jgi:hypothetical protein
MLRSDPLYGTLAANAVFDIVPPNIPSRRHGHSITSPTNDQLMGHIVASSRRQNKAFVAGRFEWNELLAAEATVGSDDNFRTRICYSAAKTFSSEATEHDGMNGANSGTSKHGDG